MDKACIAWMWLKLFRLAITLIAGWMLFQRLAGQYLAIASLFPWR